MPINWEAARSVSKLALSLLVFTLAAAAVAQANPIQEENNLPGDSYIERWLTNSDYSFEHNRAIEGYASLTSVQAGDASFGPNSIDFYVNVDNPSLDPTYSLHIFRLGWYGGTSARRMLSVTRTSIEQVMPAENPDNGSLIGASWSSPYTLTVPRTWVSGVYVALLVTDNSKLASYIPFVVRNDGRSADYIYQVPVATWQAYNCWGGRSLYGCTDAETIALLPEGNPVPAWKVSFNRPHLVKGGLPIEFNEEIGLLRFLEREGYDVMYQTDIDTHTGGGRLSAHKALISAGHNEYWTDTMRNNVEKARDSGLSLGFFGANAVYWQIRLEDFNRTIVGYKEDAFTEDPFALDDVRDNDMLITTQWRADPLNRPESALIGVMYHGSPCEGDIVVSNPSHWVYTGTNVTAGTRVTGLLGHECDSVYQSSPSQVEVLTRSPDPFPEGDPFHSNMTVYKWQCSSAPCVSPFATVFATGTLRWASGLDANAPVYLLYPFPSVTVNPIAQQMTRNVLAAFVGKQPQSGQPAISPNGFSISNPGP
jgi:hypothetical protein